MLLLQQEEEERQRLLWQQQQQEEEELLRVALAQQQLAALGVGAGGDESMPKEVALAAYHRVKTLGGNLVRPPMRASNEASNSDSLQLVSKEDG